VGNSVLITLGETMTKGNSMKQTAEEVRARIEREQERMKRQEWHGQIWRPTITERETEERKKQVDRGILPF